MLTGSHSGVRACWQIVRGLEAFNDPGKERRGGRTGVGSAYRQGEVYVKGSPDAIDRWRVSTEGGSNAFWRLDGCELSRGRARSSSWSTRLPPSSRCPVPDCDTVRAPRATFSRAVLWRTRTRASRCDRRLSSR